MLKRQRPSSPPPPAAETLLAAEPSVDLDISERVAKRTRHLAPLRRSYAQKDSVVVGSDTDGEDDQSEGWSEYSRGQTEWQEQAGLYKTANTLLHDLHAEQRHRQLFSARPSTTIPHQQGTRYPTSSYPSSLPGLARLPRDLAAPHREAPPPETPQCTQLTPEDGPEAYIEAQTVSSQYEDANRFLRDLFLNRKRRVDDGQT